MIADVSGERSPSFTAASKIARQATSPRLKSDEPVTDHQPKDLVPKDEGHERLDALEDSPHKPEDTLEMAMAK